MPAFGSQPAVRSALGSSLLSCPFPHRGVKQRPRARAPARAPRSVEGGSRSPPRYAEPSAAASPPSVVRPLKQSNAGEAADLATPPVSATPHRGRGSGGKGSGKRGKRGSSELAAAVACLLESGSDNGAVEEMLGALATLNGNAARALELCAQPPYASLGGLASGGTNSSSLLLALTNVARGATQPNVRDSAVNTLAKLILQIESPSGSPSNAPSKPLKLSEAAILAAVDCAIDVLAAAWPPAHQIDPPSCDKSHASTSAHGTNASVPEEDDRPPTTASHLEAVPEVAPPRLPHAPPPVTAVAAALALGRLAAASPAAGQAAMSAGAIRVLVAGMRSAKGAARCASVYALVGMLVGSAEGGTDAVRAPDSRRLEAVVSVGGLDALQAMLRGDTLNVVKMAVALLKLLCASPTCRAAARAEPGLLSAAADLLHPDLRFVQGRRVTAMTLPISPLMPPHGRAPPARAVVQGVSLPEACAPSGKATAGVSGHGVNDGDPCVPRLGQPFGVRHAAVRRPRSAPGLGDSQQHMMSLPTRLDLMNKIQRGAGRGGQDMRPPTRSRRRRMLRRPAAPARPSPPPRGSTRWLRIKAAAVLSQLARADEDATGVGASILTDAGLLSHLPPLVASTCVEEAAAACLLAEQFAARPAHAPALLASGTASALLARLHDAGTLSRRDPAHAVTAAAAAAIASLATAPIAGPELLAMGCPRAIVAALERGDSRAAAAAADAAAALASPAGPKGRRAAAALLAEGAAPALVGCAAGAARDDGSAEHASVHALAALARAAPRARDAAVAAGAIPPLVRALAGPACGSALAALGDVCGERASYMRQVARADAARPLLSLLETRGGRETWDVRLQAAALLEKLSFSSLVAAELAEPAALSVLAATLAGSHPEGPGTSSDGLYGHAPTPSAEGASLVPARGLQGSAPSELPTRASAARVLLRLASRPALRPALAGTAELRSALVSALDAAACAAGPSLSGAGASLSRDGDGETMGSMGLDLERAEALAAHQVHHLASKTLHLIAAESEEVRLEVWRLMALEMWATARNVYVPGMGILSIE